MRLEYCESCWRPVERTSLVRMRRKFKTLAGSNLLVASEYDATNWNVAVGYAGSAIMVGMHPDVRMVKNNSTGHGTTSGIYYFYGLAADSPNDYPILTTNATVDVSSYTTVCFSVFVGPPDVSYGGYTITPQNIAYSVGYYDLATYVPVVTGSTAGWHLVEAPVTVSNVTNKANFKPAICFTDGYTINIGSGADRINCGCFEHAQLKSGSEMGDFIKTTGTATTRTTDSSMTQVAKVCPKCRERLVEDWEKRGIPNEPPDPTIPFFGGGG